MLHLLRSLTPNQRGAVIASYLGWTLDAFDFFILVFVLKDVAQEFPYRRGDGHLRDFSYLGGKTRWGAAVWPRRRPLRPPGELMVDILLFSMLEFASGLAPSLAIFLILRLAFGVAMGGEWGVGAALAMETIPPGTRGVVSGILQTGYPSGYLLAAITYFALYGLIGWRGMFMIGVLPALLVLYIRGKVEESPAFLARAHAKLGAGLVKMLRDNAGRFLYAVLLMTAFNFLSHGTQDLYPAFLQLQRHFSQHTVGLIAIVYNIGAILGGLLFGALSQRIGRRRAILVAALLTLPIIPVWAYGAGPLTLAVGAFLMQFAVQGAWGVVPAHLNELSPEGMRGTFPGFAYQLGNLLASANATLQAGIAQANGGNYAFALATVAAIVAMTLAVLAHFGIEAHGIEFAGAEIHPDDGSRRR